MAGRIISSKLDSNFEGSEDAVKKRWKFFSKHFSNILQLFPFVSPFLFSFHYNQFTLTLAIKSLTMLITIAKLTQKSRLVNHLASESVLFFVMVPRLLSSSVIHAWNSFGFHGIGTNYPTLPPSVVACFATIPSFPIYQQCLLHKFSTRIARKTRNVFDRKLNIAHSCPLSPSRSVAGHYVE